MAYLFIEGNKAKFCDRANLVAGTSVSRGGRRNPLMVSISRSVKKITGATATLEYVVVRIDFTIEPEMAAILCRQFGV
jgi:hypothetical protein